MPAAFGELPDIAAARPPPPPLSPAKTAALALICLFWIGAGLFGRDPWKPQETDFVMLVAENIGAVGAIPPAVRPPSPSSLYVDWAAAFAEWFSPLLPPHEGARMLNALLLAAALMMIGLAAGGGRGGWMAALLTLGMTGLVVRAHLLNLAAAAFFGSAALLFAMVRLRRHALVGGALSGGAIGFLWLAASPTAAVFCAAATAAVLFRGDWRRASIVAGLAAAAMFLLPAVALSPLAGKGMDGIIAAFASDNDWSAPTDLARLSAWALFPTLPAAAAILWRRGRAAAAEPMMFFCLLTAAAAAAHFLFYGGREEDLFLLMPPLAVFAARGWRHLPDEAAAVLDWFALIVVGVCCAGGMWAARILLSFDSGWEWTAAWRAKFPLLAEAEWSVWKTALAAAATVFWIGLAVNVGRSSERALLNWSCGVTVVWSVFCLLWMPIVDSGKSHRRMAAAIVAHSGGECVSLSAAAKEAMPVYYFGAIPGDDNCRWRLQKENETPPANSRQAWQGGRYADRDYILHRRL